MDTNRYALLDEMINQQLLSNNQTKDLYNAAQLEAIKQLASLLINIIANKNG